MELGDKLRQARQEAGLSQRELCGEEITRNMLSQIENGSAQPSMKTLSYLARKLGKPVSWFLEETAVTSANISVMVAAREKFDAEDWSGAVETLTQFRQPDQVYNRERDLIWAWSHLALAEQALERGQVPYAAELLKQSEIPVAYGSRDLARKRLLLLGRTGRKVEDSLPSLDEELRLRAREALDAGDLYRAGALLDAAQDREDPRWNLLRGTVCLGQQDWKQGAACLHRAEAAFPKETVPKLEQCYKELGDFKRAYEYACKGR